MPATVRGRSTSSTRTSHVPAPTPRQLATAASREPKCSGPVGDGANRPTGTVIGAPAEKFIIFEQSLHNRRTICADHRCNLSTYKILLQTLTTHAFKHTPERQR